MSKEMERILVFVRDTKCFERIKTALYQDHLKDSLILAWDPAVSKKYSSSYNICGFSSYFNAMSLPDEQVIKESFEIFDAIEQCFSVLTPGHVPFQSAGYALGQVAFPLISYFHLIPLMRIVELVKRIIEREKPGRIYLAWSQDQFSQVLCDYAACQNISVVRCGRTFSFVRGARKFLAPFIQPIARTIRLYGQAVMRRPLPSVSEHEIIFLNTTPSHLQTMLCVQEKLPDGLREQAVFVLSHKGRAETVLRERGIPFVVARDYLKPEMILQIASDIKQCRRDWKGLAGAAECLRGVRFREVGLWKFLAPLVKYLLFNYHASIPEGGYLARAVLGQRKPKVIVCTDELDLFSRMILLGARQRGIPTLRVQYGEMGKCCPAWAYSIAERIAVFGQQTKQNLVGMGIDPKKIVVTGQPRFDRFSGESSLRERADPFGVGKDKKRVLFASNFHCGSDIAGTIGSFFTPQEYHEWLREVYLALKEFPDIQVIVKPHHNPADPLSVHRQMFDDLQINDAMQIAKPSSDISELLRACDLVVSWESTVVSEAVVLERPVVIVNLTGRPDTLPFVREGVALGAYQKEDIATSIRQALSDAAIQERMRVARERFIPQFLCSVDGQAAQRIAKIVFELASQSKEAR